MTKIESKHPNFERLVGKTPAIELLATGFTFTEGPVWQGDHLLFSDIPGNRLIRYQMLEEGPAVTTFRYPSNNSNGNTLDNQGRLLTCEHSTRRVTRTELDGSITVLATRYKTWRLSSPNDVVVRADGTIYFTDPPYGICNAERDRDIPFNGVYKVGPDGNDMTLIANFELEIPNGLAFSPDQQTLYIANSTSLTGETYPKKYRLMAYPVNRDGTLGAGTVFATMAGQEGEDGKLDSFKVDIEGNIYSSGPFGLWIYAPDGTLLGRIKTPEMMSNAAWGDADWKSLYLTCTTGLYRLRVNVPGIPVGPRENSDTLAQLREGEHEESA